MAYKHGIYGHEIPTSLVSMTSVSAGLPVVFGTAPIHLANKPAKTNTPVLCYSLKEYAEAFGYSSDFDSYTLCEFANSEFVLFNIAPAVFINVLDPSKHFTAIENQEVILTNGIGKVKEPILLDSLVVRKGALFEPAEVNIDYVQSYNDEGEVVIAAIEGGALTGLATVNISYNKIAPEKVTISDIVGGISNETGAKKGLELINDIYPKFGLVPGLILAPKYSADSTVSAVMRSKAIAINGNFKAIALADIPTDEVKTYTAVSEWKNKKNFVHPHMVACWPKVAIGGVQYHLSTQMAGVIGRTDANNDDIPYESPSNKKIQCDEALTTEGTELTIDTEIGAYLNGQGIVTALNYQGWQLWGNRTSDYPANTDVKDSYLAIRRMFCWVNNTLITTFWSKIDNPMNKRLISTIVDSANIWLNSLTAKGYLLGGRIEFREDENAITDLMDGKMYFHVYFTPPSPAREINFVQEYDPSYISTLFE